MDKIDMCATIERMSRLPPLLLVAIVWAAIYLPALGLFEIKGEEGRRILPAMAMIESGNYLVPQVGGEAYYRKPPLINWLIAGSFKIFRVRNEWTARVPSVLSILAVAIAFVTIAKQTLGAGSTMAALIWLTNFGTLEKGRLVEIEALYISLCGLAMIFWLSWWRERRSPWLTWTVPWIFLGLGWLAKGPTHLVFFYALVGFVLWKDRQWRVLFHPAHLLGIIVMMSIFAAWLIPFMHATETERMMKTWNNQFAGRITGGFFGWRAWLTTIPRALFYFLPWILVVPFLRFEKFSDENERNLARALAWSTALPLVVVGLIPGSAPRYTLPVLVPFCCLLALAFTRDAYALPAKLRSTEPVWSRVSVVFVGLFVAIGVISLPIFSFVVKEKVKNIAAEINASVPPNETLYAVDPNYQPFFFYMLAPVQYLSSVDEVPYDAHYFLTRPHEERKAMSSEQWSPKHPRVVKRVKDYRNQTLVLFALDPG